MPDRDDDRQDRPGDGRIAQLVSLVEVAAGATTDPALRAFASQVIEEARAALMGRPASIDRVLGIGQHFDDGLPMSMTFRSEDFPEPFRAAWFKRSPLLTTLDDLDSANFADDNPDALRIEGADAVASGLVDLAEHGLTCPTRRGRQAAKLILEHYVEGNFLHDDLASDIGARRRDNKAQLAVIAKRAERDEIIRELARLPRLGNLSDEDTPKRIVEEFRDYEVNGGWQNDRGRKARPQGEPRAAFWAILKLGLHYSLPNEPRLVVLVREGRGR